MVQTRVQTRALPERLLFLGRFVRNPRGVGAIAPSSRQLAQGMLAQLDIVPGVRVVELGPGTGALTGELVAQLPADGRLLLVDRDERFIAFLRGRYPGVECLCDSAEHLAGLVEERGMRPVDHIVSGLPFASLPAAVTSRVLTAIEHTLRPGGTFTTFQYLHAYRLSSARTFREETSRRLGTHPVRRAIYANLPPALVLMWRKAGPPAPVAERSAGAGGS